MNQGHGMAEIDELCVHLRSNNSEVSWVSVNNANDRIPGTSAALGAALQGNTHVKALALGPYLVDPELSFAENKSHMGGLLSFMQSSESL
jgi:hypothetical protein